MTFDIAKFRNTPLELRKSVVPVPDLAFFFAEGQPAEWVVRGLTGEEIAIANASSQRIALIVAAVEALSAASNSKPDQLDAMKTLMGCGTDTPEDLAKRFDHLTFGSIDPVIDRESAVKLFAYYPVIAYTITNKILELTGLGPDLGKALASTQTPEL